MIQCVYTFYYTLPFLPFIYLGKEKSFLTQCVGVSCILSCTTREAPLFCFRNNYFKYRDGRVFLSSFLFLKQFILYPRCHISTPPPPRETTLLQFLFWHNFSFFYHICVHPTQYLEVFCRFKTWIRRTAHTTHISVCNWPLFLLFLGSLISSQGSFAAFVSSPGRQFMEWLWQFL